MLTELQKRKLTREFNVYDINKDGYIELTDLEVIGRNLANLSGLEPGSSPYEGIFSAYMHGWLEVFRLVDFNRDNRMSLDEWLRAEDAALSSPENYARTHAGVEQAIIAILDLDGDGHGSLTEYRQILRAFQIDDSQAESWFRRLDINSDGLITNDEAVALFYDFYHSDDPNAAGNWFYGDF